MSFEGILFGAISFLTIGIWHPIVIKGEYYLGKKKCIPIFALCGTVGILVSIFVPLRWVSVGAAIFGFSAYWGILEVIKQEQRVNKGWFPKNPNRK